MLANAIKSYIVCNSCKFWSSNLDNATDIMYQVQYCSESCQLNSKLFFKRHCLCFSQNKIKIIFPRGFVNCSVGLMLACYRLVQSNKNCFKFFGQATSDNWSRNTARYSGTSINDGPRRDRQNSFVITRFRYIEVRFYRFYYF